MASYKLNIATVRGCPSATQVAKAMQEFGLPEEAEFGALNVTATPQAVFGSVVRKTRQSLPQLDAATGEITASAVERVTVYPFAIKPGAELLEVYAGTAAGIEQVGLFLGGQLALPTVVEAIERDVADMVGKIAKLTERFQLQSVRISDYAHNSYMAGPYAPKFLDSDHGRDFLAEYAEQVTAARVRFSGKAGRIGVTLCPKACFGYSCDEEDQALAQNILRKLA